MAPENYAAGKNVWDTNTGMDMDMGVETDTGKTAFKKFVEMQPRHVAAIADA